MISKKVPLDKIKESEKWLTSKYGTRFFEESVPKYEMAESGMPANAAYQLIHDELNLDGNPDLNLATFVTTWMEPEANQLIMENVHKNFIDHDEYQQTAMIEKRVVNMLARLFRVPEENSFIGVSTIGSSEAILLSLLAHKWMWRERRKAEGKSFDRPNIIFGADVHVVWEKFAKYFDVEARVVPMDSRKFILNIDEMSKMIDENTICVGAVLGTTFTGQCDPIKEINDLLLHIKKDKGWDIPIHVDGASGGFIAPFVYPDLEWDFRLEQVRSINVSGHKYGLVYPGIGWVIFKDEKYLPSDLIFNVNYLGGEMPTFTLNFSKNSDMVLAQYYNLLRLGKEGYKKIMRNILDNATYLSKRLVETGMFEELNSKMFLPVLALRLKEPINFDVYKLSEKLRERGWIVPAYTLPPNAENVAVLRVVVKENFSRDMAEMFFNDVMNACKALEEIKPKKIAKNKKERPIC